MRETVAMQQVRLLLIGVGNIGRRFVELLIHKQDTLRDRLGLELTLIGVADTSGIAVCPTGLDPQRIVRLKAEKWGVAAYPQWGQPDASALEMVHAAEADLLLEASPANLEDGQPGLGCMEAALLRGMHVVTANRAPLVLAFPRLLALAKAHSVQLRFDATVAGGLPAVNLGQRDLAAADIHCLEGIPNLTTNYILTRMAQDGLSYDKALTHAQALGHAEADPSLDVEGWDAASKLVILANAVLGVPARLSDVRIAGIRGISPKMLKHSRQRRNVILPLAVAERRGDEYRLSVQPTEVGRNDPLARLTAHQMGIVYHTDPNGVVTAIVDEVDPMPTAGAVIRDVIALYRA